MSEPLNGSDRSDVVTVPAESGETEGLTYEQLCSLTIGQLLGELDRSGEPLLLLEAMFTMSGPEANPKYQPGSNIGVMVTRNVGYIEHVKSRMRREAQQKTDAEAKAALGESP
jgi:hypothetical protein